MTATFVSARDIALAKHVAIKAPKENDIRLRTSGELEMHIIALFEVPF